MNVRHLSALLIILTTANAAAETRERDLERWLDRDAIPFVKQQLLEYPRFKGETVMFVVLEDNAPATFSNALTLSLRDRLLDAAVDTPGVTIAWRQGRANAQHGNAAIDCTRDDVHYYIGIDLSRQLDDSYKVSLRALDLEDTSWVTGFGKSWHGQLSMTQRRALHQESVDPSFRGTRDAPFTTDENDLLAEHLAHELACALLRQTGGDYIVPANSSDDTTQAIDNTIELVSNNIAAISAIELTTNAELANAELAGKAHQIDGELYQYWLTVTPLGEDSDLSSLSVSAYLLRPNVSIADKQTGHTAARATVAMPVAQQGALIGKYSFSNDAVVYFVEHQPYYGLVRLDDGACRNRSAATLVRAGDPLKFPVLYTHSRNSEAIKTDTWYVTPKRDTYYAIALSDEKAARRMANLLDQLPNRCSASTRPGLTGLALQNWLHEFSLLAEKNSQFIDWRAIELRDVL